MRGGRACLPGDREEVPDVHQSAVWRGHLAPTPTGHRPYRARTQGAKSTLHRDQPRRSGEGTLRAGVLPARRDGEPHQGAAARLVRRPHLEHPVVDEPISGGARGLGLYPDRDDASHRTAGHGPCPSAMPNPATTTSEARRDGDPHAVPGRQTFASPHRTAASYSGPRPDLALCALGPIGGRDSIRRGLGPRAAPECGVWTPSSSRPSDTGAARPRWFPGFSSQLHASRPRVSRRAGISRGPGRCPRGCRRWIRGRPRCGSCPGSPPPRAAPRRRAGGGWSRRDG